MSYNTKEIITDSRKQPVPQYFNEQEDRYEVIVGKYGANSFIQRGTIAQESWEGENDTVMEFPSNRYGFSIINDGDAELTFEINGNIRTVKGKEPYHALFPAFRRVTISTISPYRAEVLE